MKECVQRYFKKAAIKQDSTSASEQVVAKNPYNCDLSSMDIAAIGGSFSEHFFISPLTVAFYRFHFCDSNL